MRKKTTIEREIRRLKAIRRMKGGLASRDAGAAAGILEWVLGQKEHRPSTFANGNCVEVYPKDIKTPHTRF